MAKTKDYLMLSVLMLACLSVPESYLTGQQSVYGAFTYHFTHANIWHLTLNTLFLLRYKPRWKSTLSGWLCASVAALCPGMACAYPTCGLSGICYAMAARSDVWHGSPNPWLLLSNVPMALTGVFNWKIHLMSYSISYLLWTTIHRRKRKS